MCPDTLVEIPDGSGNQYRYRYNPESGKTEYRGPVGAAPELGESEFLSMVSQTRRPLTEMEWDTLIERSERLNDEIRSKQKKITRLQRQVMATRREIDDMRDSKMKDEVVLSEVHYGKVMRTYQDPDDWMKSISPFKVPNIRSGMFARQAIAEFHGGAEFDPTTLEVWSKGRSFYTGEMS